jgi:predicted Zn-dependent protease
LLGDNEDNPTGAAIMYGAANWHYYSGEPDKADEMLRELVSTDSWSAFGYIAAEADLAAR